MRCPRFLFCVTTAAMGACGPAQPIDAELTELCEQPGPTRLMSLEPGERVRGTPLLTVVDSAQRIVLGTAPLGFDDNQLDEQDAVGVHVYSVDPCGNDPVQIAEGLDRVWTEPQWGDRLLGCVAAGEDVYVLDVGGTPPRLAFEGSGCRGTWTSRGLVARQSAQEDDDGFGPMLLYPYPEGDLDVSVPVTLHPDLLSFTGAIQAGRGWPRVTEADVVALTRDRNLIRVDLGTLAVSTVAEGVFDFKASDELFLLQEHGDGPGGSGPIVVMDRDAEETVRLTDGVLADSLEPFDLRGQQTIIVATGPPAHELRMFQPPATDHVTVSGGDWITEVLHDGRLLLAQDTSGGYALFDPETGEQTPVFGREADVRLEDDGILFHEVPTCCQHRAYQVQGSVVLQRYEGGQETLAASVARGWHRNADGRIIARVDVRDNNVGTLVAVDPTRAGEERVVHPAVSKTFDLAEWPNDLWYSTADGNPGVYRARLTERSPG